MTWVSGAFLLAATGWFGGLSSARRRARRTWGVFDARLGTGRWLSAARAAVLGVSCRNSRCRATNPRHARFCRQCGTAVVVPAGDRRPAPNWQWGRGSRGGLW